MILPRKMTLRDQQTPPWGGLSPTAISARSTAVSQRQPAEQEWASADDSFLPRSAVTKRPNLQGGPVSLTNQRALALGSSLPGKLQQFAGRPAGVGVD